MNTSIIIGAGIGFVIGMIIGFIFYGTIGPAIGIGTAGAIILAFAAHFLTNA